MSLQLADVARHKGTCTVVRGPCGAVPLSLPACAAGMYAATGSQRQSGQPGTKERITEVVYAVRLHKLVWVENKFGTVYPRWLI